MVIMVMEIITILVIIITIVIITIMVIMVIMAIMVIMVIITIMARVGLDILQDISQYNLSYYKTKIPVHKQSQLYFLNSWYYIASSYLPKKVTNSYNLIEASRGT